jgi:hypothetical protein
MKEPVAPQPFFDGSLKELATRHLGLVRAVFFALLVALPLSIFALNFSESYCRRLIRDNKDYMEYKAAWVAWQKVHSDPHKPFYDYIPPDPGLPDLDDLPGVFETPLYLYVPTENSDLIIALARGSAVFLLLCATVNLLYRFNGLAVLLFPHVGVYFTLMLFVPFLNILVILLLCRAGLKQMRARGLRVGFFGIDPARVD